MEEIDNSLANKAATIQREGMVKIDHNEQAFTVLCLENKDTLYHIICSGEESPMLEYTRLTRILGNEMANRRTVMKGFYLHVLGLIQSYESIPAQNHTQ